MLEEHAQPSVPIEVFSNYFAGSLLGLVTWWLESDMPYPPEQMTEMFQKLFFQGARQVLGLPIPEKAGPNRPPEDALIS
jgi:hypothetical protein